MSDEQAPDAPVEASAVRKRTGSVDLLSRTGMGEAPEIERMPEPSIRTMVAMRDGTRLDTYVWLPKGVERAPAILSRTPYREDVLGWARLGQMRYVEAGYALVYQMIRGTGRSEGQFGFSAPHEKTDGYDMVEWIAAQPWSDGAVGMDGGSYVGMTQLAAASARPPHLRCIIPHVVSADFFREIPYFGGGFSRQHTLNWTKLISVDSLRELTGGFVSVMPILAQPDWVRRIMLRPALDAADGLLDGDKLAHYRDALAHPTFDDWWRERTLGPADYAAMDLPMLLVTGIFDLSIGTMTVWHGLAEHGPDRTGPTASFSLGRGITAGRMSGRASATARSRSGRRGWATHIRSGWPSSTSISGAGVTGRSSAGGPKSSSAGARHIAASMPIRRGK